MKELTKILNKYNSDKGTIRGHAHKFSEIYDEYFKNCKEAKNILEIGINEGESLKAWEEYFLNAFIDGIDIDDKSYLNTNKIKCHIADQSNKDQLLNFKNNINKKFDIIIDDGSHHMRDQQITFGVFFDMLNPGGIYIIEDLHTSLGENGDDLYFRPLEIFSDRTNTTLYFLKNINQGSYYLTDDENNYLINNIKAIKIYEEENNKTTDYYKNKSITSVIIKN